MLSARLGRELCVVVQISVGEQYAFGNMREAEQVPASCIRVGDRIQNPSGTAWITVVRIRSEVIVRKIDTVQDTTKIFEFEDGEEGEQVWTVVASELVTRLASPDF
ncbi:hypothetical protein [Mycolicibacterium hodleri]|uniref:Uncharacterized protein n=1 Tax=Mycolicibacterium hodleri TaxID=49897 RepID=A0A502EAR6_9MYCO|nr:hypothetical protein [Mycolicibacterium hodleri]TPG33570.1 hypothetical protein EAH80_14915 [Mycolicibacterium hodleri]